MCIVYAAVVHKGVCFSVFNKMILWIVDVHNPCSGAMLTKAASLLSAILHLALTF